MSTERDVAPLLRSWLRTNADGSVDHVIDAILAEVDTTPQRRATWWPARRPFPMNTMMKFGIAAAVLAMTVAIGYGLWQTVGNVVPDPAPSDDVSSPGGDLPPELQRIFLGSPRLVEELSDDPFVVIELTGGVFRAGREFSVSHLASVPSITQSGVLRLETRADETGCATGDVGTYPYALSDGGTRLTFSGGSDDCAARAAVVEGDWRLMDCRDGGNWCLGPLEAGPQTSLFFDPYAGPAPRDPTRYEVLSYEVPSGWANAHDWIDVHTLVRAEGYDEESSDGCLDCPDGIWVGVAPSVIAPGCENESDAEVGTSVEAISEWVRGNPGLQVTVGPAISVDGRPTVVLDIVAVEDSAAACQDPEFDVTHIPLFTNGAYDFGIRTGDHHRLILVEIDAETAMLIGIDSLDPAELDAVIAETQPIIESMRLTAP
jgi:hypothetical protein